MSGIAGIVVAEPGKPADPADIGAMLRAMSRRARDGARHWVDGDAALAHAWLDTTGEGAGGPLVMDDGRFAIVADCRLDNRDELVARFGLRDRGVCDALLILHAYLRWGRECPAHLEGDFAFALRDRERRILFCARDHFGVKPFYYHVSAKRFAFASDIRPIFAACGLGRRINDHSLAGLLAGLPDDVETTLYVDVLRLPPRHCLTYENGRVVVSAYWQLEPGRHPPRGDTADAFRHLFAQAVEKRLRGTTGIGTMLSGGLDSSSIACVASDRLAAAGARPLNTYSLVFDPRSGMDERRHIEAVLATGRFDPRFVAVADHAPFREFEHVLDEQEGVFLAPGLTTTRSLYDAARADGVRVLLDGHGGDEVVSHGYGRLRELADEDRVIALWRELRGSSQVHGTDIWRSYFGLMAAFSPSRPVAMLAGGAGRALRALRREPSRRPQWTGLVNPDLARRTGLGDRFRHFNRPPYGARANEALLHRWQLSSALVPHAFEVLDKAAAAFGIEPRYPFWDKPLVEFCLGLPSHEKLRDGWSRHVLRRAMTGILPPSVQWRRDKIDFRPNLVGGMLRNHRPLLERVLGAEGDRIAAYVDVAGVKAAYRRLLERPADAHIDDIQSVWRSVSLALWLRHVQEGEPPS